MASTVIRQLFADIDGAIHQAPASISLFRSPEDQQPAAQDNRRRDPDAAGEATPQVTLQVELSISVIDGDMTRTEIMAQLKLKDRMHFARVYLQPALSDGIVESNRSAEHRLLAID